MGDAEAFAAGVDELAAEVGGGREGDGVDEDVELAVLFLERGEEGVDFLRRLETSHWKPLAPGRSSMRLLGFELHALVLVADGQGGAGLVEFLGDAPGDGTLVGQPEDHGRLTRQIDHAFPVPPMVRLLNVCLEKSRAHRILEYQPERDDSAAEVDQFDLADGRPRKRDPRRSNFSTESVAKNRRIGSAGVGFRRCAEVATQMHHEFVGRGFGGVDDPHVRRDNALDEWPEQRVVGAAEDQRVRIEALRCGLGVEFVEIDADDFGGDGMVGPAFLNERNQKRTGFLEGAQALGAAGCSVGVALYRGVGCDDEDVAGLARLCGQPARRARSLR